MSKSTNIPFVVDWRMHMACCQELKPTTKHVLHTIALHMSPSGQNCHPTIDQIMYESGLSNRAILTHINLAESAGWLRKKKHGYGGQKWANNEYEPTVPNGYELVTYTDSKRQKAVNEVHDVKDKGSERGSPPSKEKVVNLTTEGSEPNDQKVVNEVHTSSSLSSSVVEKEKEKEKTSPPADAESKKPNPRIMPGAMTECDGECNPDFPRQLCKTCKTKWENCKAFGKKMNENFSVHSSRWGGYFLVVTDEGIAKACFKKNYSSEPAEVCRMIDVLIQRGAPFDPKNKIHFSVAIGFAITNLQTESAAA